ncbi:MAG: DinB family protein [Bacteroidetes bacterium]|nr:DinB family protein [Bacteroidota bacterium]
MIKDINKKLAQEVRNTLDGDTWYASNFLAVIRDVTARTAVQKLIGFPNSIAEIVYHMTQWKKFCIKKTEGDASFDIVLHSEEDWKRFDSLEDKEWEKIKSDYAKATIDLSHSIRLLPDERLEDKVPGRGYSYFHLLIGVIEHETAHTTQISYLKKLQNNS